MERIYQTLKGNAARVRLKYQEQELFFLVPLVLFVVIKNLLYLAWQIFVGRGIPQSPDGRWYLNYAAAFLDNLRDGLDVNDILYFGYNALLSVLLAVFQDPVAVLVIQGVTAGLSVILVYKIAAILFNRRTAVIASIFYACIFEFTRWSLFILSDSFFVSLLLLCVYFLLMAMEHDRRQYRRWFSIAALYLAVFRPTGLVVIVFVAIYLLLQMEKDRLQIYFMRYRTWLLAAGLLLTAAVGLLYWGNKLNLFIQSFQFEVQKVLYNVYAKGWVYDKSTPFDHAYRPRYELTVGDSAILSFICNNWENIGILYAKRAIAFLGTWVWSAKTDSVLGILGVAANLIPAVLFLIGTVAAIRNRLFLRASILWMLVVAVYLFCMVLFIDAMYRYRFPALPFIAIIAAYGAEQILHKAMAGEKISTRMRSIVWEKERC